MFGVVFLILVLAVLAAVTTLAFRTKSDQPPGGFRSLATAALWSAGVLLVGAGVSGVVRRMVPTGDVFRSETIQLARSLSYLAIGIPLIVGLWGQLSVWVERRHGGVGWLLGWPVVSLTALIAGGVGWAQTIAWLAGGPSSPAGVGRMVAWSAILAAMIGLEKTRHGWWAGEESKALYALILPVLSTATLVVGFVGLGQAFTWLIGGEPQPEPLGLGLVFGSIWLATRILERRVPPGHQVTPLGWAIVSLVALASGGFRFLLALFETAFERFFTTVLVETVSNRIGQTAVWAVWGLVVWIGLWLRDGLIRPETKGRQVFALLLGVTIPILVLISTSAGAVFLVAEWLIGHPETNQAGIHFMPLPRLLAGVLVSWGLFIHHLRVAHVPDPSDRPARYIVTGAGVGAATAGLGTIVIALLTALTGAVVAGDTGTDVLLGGATALIAGGLAWQTQRKVMDRRVSVDPTERTRPSRKLYLGAVLVVTVLGFLVSAIGVLFQLFEAVLGEGRLGSEQTAGAVGVLVATGLVGWNHWQTWREDRRQTPVVEEAPVAAVREVMIVTGGDAAGLRASLLPTGHRIWVWTSTGLPAYEAREFEEAMAGNGGARVLLIGRADGIEVLSLER